MALGTTLTGVPFEYEGSLETGVTILFSASRLKISPETILLIRNQIRDSGSVLMGARRGPLVADSIGETLSEEHGVTPQVLSYIIPLLINEGFCTASDKKPFMIRWIGKE